MLATEMLKVCQINLLLFLVKFFINMILVITQKAIQSFQCHGANSVFDGSKSIINLGLTICDICTLEIQECRKC